MRKPLAPLENGVPRKRYVKIPETAAVKRYRDQWLVETAGLDPLAHCLDILYTGHRLTIGRFGRSHWYCSIVSDVERPEDFPNALSGWGDTPFKALAELAFRWHCCMRGSWSPDAWNLELVPILVDRTTMEVIARA